MFFFLSSRGKLPYGATLLCTLKANDLLVNIIILTSITKKEKPWNFSRCKTVTSASYCSLGVNTKGTIRKWKPKETNWSISVVFSQCLCHRCHISILKGLRKQIHPIERFTQLRPEKTDVASLVFSVVFQGDTYYDAKLLQVLKLEKKIWIPFYWS